MYTKDCIFCAIAAGEAPAHKIWENDEYLAFLSIFPNTEGFSVVIPKTHEGSYFAEAPDALLHGLVQAAAVVAKKIDAAYPDVGRTGLIFEGFGVDHLHAKLVPMHGTQSGEWKRHISKERKFSHVYEGYISSHDSERAPDDVLAEIAKKIRGIE